MVMQKNIAIILAIVKFMGWGIHPFPKASSLVLWLLLPILQYRLQADKAVLAVELEVDVAALDLEY